MDPALLFMLMGLIVLAALSFWFGFIRPPRVLAWLSQAGFVTTTFMLIPLTLYVLFGQATSIDRLKTMGIEPHPSISHTLGLATGQGESPTWIFALDLEAEEPLEYYRSAMAESEWKVFEDTGLYLRYQKNDQSLMIASTRNPGNRTLIITVTSSP